MGDDDLFGAAEEGDELSGYDDLEQEDEESSSSGCEPDMVSVLILLSCKHFSVTLQSYFSV
jgi:hypothetical protein